MRCNPWPYAVLLCIPAVASAQRASQGVDEAAAIRKTIQAHYFEVVRAGGEWQIVSKIFQRYPKP